MSASVQLAGVVGMVARLGARASSAADGGISGRKGQGGQTMRTETSDSNYNISTAAQPASKNERKNEAGLKRVWWARNKAREGKRSGEWRRRSYLSEGQAMSRSPEARRLREHGGVQLRPGAANQPEPIGRSPQDTAHLSAGSAQNNPTHDRLRLAAEGLELAQRVEKLAGRAGFCSPTAAAAGLPSFLRAAWLERDAQSSSLAMGRRRDLALSGAWGLPRRQGTNATASPIGHTRLRRLICLSVEELGS